MSHDVKFSLGLNERSFALDGGMGFVLMAPPYRLRQGNRVMVLVGDNPLLLQTNGEGLRGQCRR